MARAPWAAPSEHAGARFLLSEWDVTLGLRIGLIVLAGVLVVQATFTWLRLGREAALFDSDLRADHELLGRALGGAIAEIQRQEGTPGADAFVRRANAAYPRASLRWVSFEDPTPDTRPAVAPSILQPLEPGATRHFEASGQLLDGPAAGDERLYTYVSASLPGRGTGAIEIVESLRAKEAYLTTSLRNSLGAAVGTALLAALLAMLVGSWYVGRPVRVLRNQARRIAGGDYSCVPSLPPGGELRALAEDLNRMAHEVCLAHDKSRAESRVRLEILEQLRHAEKLSTVGQVTSALAHELGTPINVVNGYAGLLSRRRLNDEEARVAATEITRQCERMTVLVRRLLGYARRSPPAVAPTDLSDVVRTAIGLLAPFAAGRGVRVELEVEQDAISRVDAPQIQQAVSNLVMNAVQASRPGGTVRVAVDRTTAPDPLEVGHQQPMLTVSVSDDGVGIDEDAMGRVFEPFFTTKPSGEGTGLGLSIARDIVEGHGGWIAFTSTPGRGTRFEVFLRVLRQPSLEPCPETFLSSTTTSLPAS